MDEEADYLLSFRVEYLTFACGLDMHGHCDPQLWFATCRPASFACGSLLNVLDVVHMRQ